jgi:IMP cyclohydrolase
MKTKLQRVIERVIEMRDAAHDDEFTDELDNALLHLDAASDRLIAMEEEEDEGDNE